MRRRPKRGTKPASRTAARRSRTRRASVRMALISLICVTPMATSSSGLLGKLPDFLAEPKLRRAVLSGRFFRSGGRRRPPVSLERIRPLSLPRQDPQRCQARRSARLLIDQLRAGRHSQYRHGARPDGAAIDPRPRRRGYRMSRPSLVGTLALVFLSVATPHRAGAQPAEKVARGGVLGSGDLAAR